MVLLRVDQEALLWVVGNIRSEYWEDVTNEAVGANHIGSIAACLNKRLQDLLHTMVPELITSDASVVVSEAS